jgi:group I intron endonuclease
VSSISVQYHEVKINIEYAPLTSLYWAADISGANPVTSAHPNGLTVGDMTSSSLWVDYIYLDTDERRRFAQVSHEYLLHQRGKKQPPTSTQTLLVRKCVGNLRRASRTVINVTRMPSFAVASECALCTIRDTFKLRETPSTFTTNTLPNRCVGQEQEPGYSKNVKAATMDNPQQLQHKDISLYTHMGLIYCITFPSGKKYVGQTVQTIEERVKQHTRCKSCPLVYRALNKYSSYQVETLLQLNDNPDLLDMYEIKFIAMLNTLKPNGYNLSTGGGTGRKHSEFSRLQMSQAHLGVPLSDHHRQRLSESHQGRVFTDETKSKISQSKLGKSRGDAFKALMSQQSRKHGNDLPMYVYKVKNGYKARLDGKDKSFANSKVPDEEKLKKAIEYVNSMKLSND